MKFLLLPVVVLGLLSVVVLGAVPLTAAPVPKRPPPSETAIVIADSLEKPTWKLRAAVKWRVSPSQKGGVLIEGWDFSDSIAAMPRDEIKNRVKFPKIEPGATAWLDTPGDRIIMVNERTSPKETWKERGNLEIDGDLIRAGYHCLEARISDWQHPKKRFEFWIREVDGDGRIADAFININGNGTIGHCTGTLGFTFTCPDEEVVYTRGSVWLGAQYWSSEMRRHDDWELKGRKDISRGFTVEYAISNRK